MAKVQTAMDTLIGGAGDSKDDTGRAALLDELRADLSTFGKELLEHLDHEEHSFATPVARKVGGEYLLGRGWRYDVQIWVVCRCE